MFTSSVKSAVEIELNVTVKNHTSLKGGCVNDCYKLETVNGNYFLKINSANRYPGMFEAEANGLILLQKTGVMAIPEVITVGESEGSSFLLLEYIDREITLPDFWRNFGRRLALLHKNSSGKFGLNHNNYIGSLPQSNTLHSDWISFFKEERLDPQLKLARDSKKITATLLKSFDKLFASIANLFPEEPPALLHGDLWSGNYLVGKKGEPLLIDPAAYYGHREMDVAMTRLFGGFDATFYSAYNDEYPLQKRWIERMDICNLYPLLVHVNLFGGGYVSQVEQAMRHFS